MPNIVLYTSCILSFLNLTTCEIDIIIEEPIKEKSEKHRYMCMYN